MLKGHYGAQENATVGIGSAPSRNAHILSRWFDIIGINERTAQQCYFCPAMQAIEFNLRTIFHFGGIAHRDRLESQAGQTSDHATVAMMVENLIEPSVCACVHRHCAWRTSADCGE